MDIYNYSNNKNDQLVSTIPVQQSMSIKKKLKMFMNIKVKKLNIFYCL